MNGFSGHSGGASASLASFFEENQGIPISRDEVRAIADQLDYMKRLRRNGGARDILDQKGIALLWGKGDRGVIAELKLGTVTDAEFISYTPKDAAELSLLRTSGHAGLQEPADW